MRPIAAMTSRHGVPWISGIAGGGSHTVHSAVGAGVAIFVLLTALWLAGDMPSNVRIVLTVLGIAAIGWTLTPISDTAIAAGAVVALIIAGILKPQHILQSATHELVWLLLASLIFAGVLSATGLVERIVWGLCRRVGSLRQLVVVLTAAITLTAFLIPSTTARAALLVPVFLSLAGQMDCKHAVRGFALLFPTVILLSASGSLIGAGAHVIAVEYIFQTTGERVSYLSWLMLMLPFALLSCVLAAAVITSRYIPRRAFNPPFPPCEPHWTRDQLIMASIVGGTALLFATYPAHGWSPAVITMVAAVCALLTHATPASTKPLIKRSDLQLVAFIVSTLALAQAVTTSGAGRWLAEQALQTVPHAMMTLPFVVAFIAVVSLASHLVIGSRTARAAVILSAVALPLAGMGHDPKALILITVLGTGFCQTQTASAKPLAIFASAGAVTYRSADLLWLSVMLLPVMFGLLMAFAVAVAV